MNAYLNYLLEASIGLCLFLLVYQVFLRKETSFRLNRFFLLIAILASVTFPLLKLNTADSPVPSLNFSVEPALTEELIYANDSALAESYPALTTWEILAILYAAGLGVFLIVFVIRLAGMLRALKRSSKYNFNEHHIVELKSQDSPFSFFNYIFIGSTPPLTEKEKQQIIEHESIHAKLYHSVDIVLLNILGIVFWFNPFVRIYKKIFVQLHEFEADARAVSTHDVDDYCSLLARVALYSADYKLANHFSNSLTIKRIEMMRTLKQKIKSWKVIAVAMVIPIVFFVVACQDQVEDEPQEQYIERPIEWPAAVTDALADLQKKHPNDIFLVRPPGFESFKLDENTKEQLVLDVVTTSDGKNTYTADAITIINTGDKKAKGGKELWMIFQYKDNPKPTSELREIDGRPVFKAVEQQAIPPGGLDAFLASLKQKIKYPASAKQAGIEGRVFIKFIVWSDGMVSGFQIMKGINKEIDEEALRVLKEQAAAKKWTPGMQKGGKVNSQYVIPIQFRLN